jgi:hypothetical protein
MKIYVSVFLILFLQLISNLCFASDTNIFANEKAVLGREISLVTVMSNTTGRGGHSSLIIKSTETVIFDPAGRVRSKLLKEKADVLYYIDQNLEDFYLSVHARKTHHVVKQSLSVSDIIANKALNLAKTNGPVAPALCTRSVSLLLRKLPRFGSVKVTYFPEKLMESFGKIEGVRTKKIFEYDEHDKQKTLIELEKKYGEKK